MHSKTRARGHHGIRPATSRGGLAAQHRTLNSCLGCDLFARRRRREGSQACSWLSCGAKSEPSPRPRCACQHTTAAWVKTLPHYTLCPSSAHHSPAFPCCLAFALPTAQLQACRCATSLSGKPAASCRLPGCPRSNYRCVKRCALGLCFHFVLARVPWRGFVDGACCQKPLRHPPPRKAPAACAPYASQASRLRQLCGCLGGEAALAGLVPQPAPAAEAALSLSKCSLHHPAQHSPHTAAPRFHPQCEA